MQEHGTKVMWFHTGNYTEMMQEVTSIVASQQLLCVNSTAIFHRPSSLSLKNILDRYREVFLLEPVTSFALTEVNIVKRNSQHLPMQMSLPDFKRLQYIARYMHTSCKVGIPIPRRKRLVLYFGFLHSDEITIRVTIRPS